MITSSVIPPGHSADPGTGQCAGHRVHPSLVVETQAQKQNLIARDVWDCASVPLSHSSQFRAAQPHLSGFLPVGRDVMSSYRHRQKLHVASVVGEPEIAMVAEGRRHCQPFCQGSSEIFPSFAIEF